MKKLGNKQKKNEERRMKKVSLILLSSFILFSLFTLLLSCASKPKVKIVEMENKGTAMNISAPDWIKVYVADGISKVQARSEFKEKYVVIGEETGVNRQFVLAWADNFSAQQRIGNMLRTTIVSKYQAGVDAKANTVGGANSTTSAGTGSGDYNQQIDSIITSVINVSYSGAQRESDWWILRRRYDPDIKDTYTDEYTAYVLYTIPKAEFNRQVAYALETAVKKDSALYDITIEMAKAILKEGMAEWGEGVTKEITTTSLTNENVKTVTN